MNNRTMPLGNTLIQNPSGGPIQGAGSADLTNNVSESLMNIFSPGANNTGPTKQYNNPLEGKLIPRFEVPDTVSTVDLGKTVVFYMMSDGETFYTDTICPIVPWGWGLKRITYGTWVFPQYPVRPTPETAPPRYPESYMLSDSTTLIRFSIGDHMSVEHMKTAHGRAKQTYTLKQIALSTQETLNLNVISALMNSQYKVAERREKAQSGGYNYDDLMRAIKTDIKRFAGIQKEKFGFQKTIDEIKQEMRQIGGGATGIIMTERANALVITRPELTDYSEAGPAGPARVADPNRTILPASLGLETWYSKTYKERFSATLGPWEKYMQFGEFYVSEELPSLRDRGFDYKKNYNSKYRSVWIYDAYVDKFVEMKAEDMVDNCKIWDVNGELIEPRSDSGQPLPETQKGDFLMMKGSSMIRGAWDEDPFLGHLNFGITPAMGKGRIPTNATHVKPNTAITTPKSFIDDARWRSVQLLGHLAKEHFGKENFLECGEMILFRIAENACMDYQTMMMGIQNGLNLFKVLSEQAPDLDFVDFVLADACITMYGADNPGMNSVARESSKLFSGTWVDDTVDNPDALMKKMVDSMLLTKKDNDEGNQVAIKYLKNVGSNDICLPLPLATHSGGNYKKHWPHLTGYCSYAGLVAMSKAHSSVAHGSDEVRKRYNLSHLATADTFVNIMRHFVASINRILPNCSLFGGSTNDFTKAKIIAERLFNMVGLPMWMNLRKTSVFLWDKETFTKRPTGNRTDAFVGPKASWDDFIDPAHEEGRSWYAKLMWNSFGTKVTDLSPSEVVSNLRVVLTKASKSKKGNLSQFKTRKVVSVLTTLKNKDDYVELVTKWMKSPAVDNAKMDSMLKSKVVELCESINSFVPSIISYGSSALILSGKFRIEACRLIWGILDIAISKLQNNIETLLACVEDLALLMLPEGSNDADYDQANSFLAEQYIPDKFSSIRARKTKFLMPIEAKDVILGIFQRYLGSEDFDGTIIDNLRNGLEEALEYDTSILKVEIDAAAKATGNDITLALPVLENSVDGLKIKKDGKVTISKDMNMKEFLELLTTEKVDEYFNVKAQLDAKSNLGDVFGSVMIGSKHKHQVQGKSDYDPVKSVGEFSEGSGAMVKTSLVFSAEQIKILHTQRLYGNSTKYVFDIRVTNPGNLSSYVPVGQLSKVVTEIEKVDHGSSGDGKLVHWRQVPLLSAERKLKTIVFSGDRHRSYGVAVKFLNHSFFNTCQSLDATCSTYSAAKSTTALYMLAPFNRKTIHALINSNIRFPIGFLLLRPHMSVITEACALLKPGINNLGFTALAGKDYITGQTTLTKEWNTNLSFWTNVILTHPENCYILHNLMISGMKQGLGSIYFTEPGIYDPVKVVPTLEGVEDYPSVFSIAIPFTENPSSKSIIATPGKVPHLAMGTKSTAYKVSRSHAEEVHYSTCERYCKIWGFHRSKDGRIMAFLNHMGSGGTHGVFNTLCSPGACKYWNPTRKDTSFVRIGQGHLGPNVGPGLQAVLNGDAVSFPVFNYNTDPGYIGV